MGIITISRETGSLGDAAARLLAEKLQYTLVDRGALEKIIDGKKFPDIPLEQFDEQSPSFWENFTSGKDVYLDRLRTAILEAAIVGDVVFLGRGAQFILAGVPGIFRVRLIAGRDIRVKRMSKVLDCDTKTAERYCKRSDYDRKGYSRFFFRGHWANSDSYEITLCTNFLSVEVATEIVLQAYKASSAESEDGSSVLANRFLAQVVRNRILYVRNIPIDLLEVGAEDGHISIRGTVTTQNAVQYCEEAARTVKGVRAVDTEIYFINPVMTY